MRRSIARILKQETEDRDLNALAVLIKEADSNGYIGTKVDDGIDALAWGSNPVVAVYQQQAALLEDIKCAKVAEACPEGSTSLLVKKKWFDPRGGCVASCVHLETGDGGAGGAPDTASTAAQADGSDDDNTKTPEASLKLNAGRDRAASARVEPLPLHQKRSGTLGACLGDLGALYVLQEGRLLLEYSLHRVRTPGEGVYSVVDLPASVALRAGLLEEGVESNEVVAVFRLLLEDTGDVPPVNLAPLAGVVYFVERGKMEDGQRGACLVSIFSLADEGCAIASCVHLEDGGGGRGGGGARDSERTAAQAEGSGEDTTGAPEASFKGGVTADARSGVEERAVWRRPLREASTGTS